MKRAFFDKLLSASGAVVVAVLLVSGGLLMWGNNFATSSVHQQLLEQHIVFPAKNSPAIASPEIRPYLLPYAGQVMTTGPQAKAYADHFIAVHLKELPSGGVYSTLSRKAMADPTNAKLAAVVETSFRGTVLRGLLLEAYGFWMFGEIALWAAIASFSLAGVMAVLVILGLWHARAASATGSGETGSDNRSQRELDLVTTS